MPIYLVVNLSSRNLLNQKIRKERIHPICFFQLANPTHILVWPHNYRTSLLRIDAIICISIPMTFMVGLIIHKDLPVIPAELLTERMEDLWQVMNCAICPPTAVDCQNLDDCV